MFKVKSVNFNKIENKTLGYIIMELANYTHIYGPLSFSTQVTVNILYVSPGIEGEKREGKGKEKNDFIISLRI